MPIIDSAELPIAHIKLTGPGVDAIENRKEIGSTVCLEDDVNERLRTYGQSELGRRNMAALVEFANFPIRGVS